MSEWHLRHRSGSDSHPSIAGIRRAFFRFVIAGLVLAAVGSGRAAPLPFADDFESYSEGGLNGLSPNGTNVWAALDAVVQTNTVNAGSKAVSLTSSNAYARQIFNDGQTNVWTDLYVQPAFGADDGSVDVPEAGSSFAFYVNTSSNVVVYDGTTQTALAQTVSAGQWVRFTVRSEYTTRSWDLHMGGVKPAVAAGLGFYDTNAAACTEFGVRGGGASGSARADDVNITLNDPLSPSTTTTTTTSTTTVVTTTTTSSTTAPPLPLPFADDFESYSEGGLNGLSPNGTNVWAALDAVVQTNTVNAGSKAVSLTSSNAYARQIFNDGQTNVWTDLYVQPAFGADDGSVDVPEAGSSFAFYVNTSSNVVVYDGTTQTALAQTVSAGQWVRFTVRSEYTTRSWDLHMGGVKPAVAAGLGFYDTNAAACTEFGVRGGGASGSARADDVNITLNDPLSPSTTTTSTTSTTTVVTTSTTTVVTTTTTSTTSTTTVVTTSTTTTTTPVQAALVNHWKFDEASWNGTAGEVVDSSGNGHHGTAIGGPTTVAGRGGFWGRAASLDGVNDWLDFGDSPDYDLLAFTFTAWINLNQDEAAPVDFQIIDKDKQYQWRLDFDGTDQLQLGVWDAIATPGHRGNQTAWDTGVWYHVACVAGGGTLQHYLDGIPDGSAGGYIEPLDTSAGVKLGIGANVAGSGKFFDGLIDDVRMYDTALTQSEIQEVMSEESVPQATGVIIFIR